MAILCISINIMSHALSDEIALFMEIFMEVKYGGKGYNRNMYN